MFMNNVVLLESLFQMKFFLLMTLFEVGERSIQTLQRLTVNLLRASLLVFV